MERKIKHPLCSESVLHNLLNFTYSMFITNATHWQLLKPVWVCAEVLKGLSHTNAIQNDFTLQRTNISQEGGGARLCMSDSVTGLEETLRVDWREACNLLTTSSVFQHGPGDLWLWDFDMSRKVCWWNDCGTDASVNLHLLDILMFVLCHFIFS